MVKERDVIQSDMLTLRMEASSSKDKVVKNERNEETLISGKSLSSLKGDSFKARKASSFSL